VPTVVVIAVVVNVVTRFAFIEFTFPLVSKIIRHK